MAHNVSILSRIVGVYRGFNHEKISIGTAATSLTVASYAPSGSTPAQAAIITCETGQIRYRYDGTAPTSTTGHLLSPGGSVIIHDSKNIEQFQAIVPGTAAAALSVSYER